MTSDRKKRAWTPEQRAEQARRLKSRQIWLKSTGPRSAIGKERSSRNSYKHGLYSREILGCRADLCHVSRLLKYLNHLYASKNKAQKNKNPRNELRDPLNVSPSGQSNSLALTPLFQYESACLSGTKARPDKIVVLPLSSGGVGISYF